MPSASSSEGGTCTAAPLLLPLLLPLLHSSTLLPAAQRPLSAPSGPQELREGVPGRSQRSPLLALLVRSSPPPCVALSSV